MPRSYNKTLIFLAQSYNFSDMKFPDGTEFDIGDEGRADESVTSDMQADAYLLSLLLKMPDRQKVILMYQLLREAGYNINHADSAATLGITRERYMTLLKDVKKRSAKILQIGKE